MSLVNDDVGYRLFTGSLLQFLDQFPPLTGKRPAGLSLRDVPQFQQLCNISPGNGFSRFFMDADKHLDEARMKWKQSAGIHLPADVVARQDIQTRIIPVGVIDNFFSGQNDRRFMVFEDCQPIKRFVCIRRTVMSEVVQGLFSHTKPERHVIFSPDKTDLIALHLNIGYFNRHHVSPKNHLAGSGSISCTVTKCGN